MHSKLGSSCKVLLGAIAVTLILGSIGIFVWSPTVMNIVRVESPDGLWVATVDELIYTSRFTEPRLRVDLYHNYFLGSLFSRTIVEIDGDYSNDGIAVRWDGPALRIKLPNGVSIVGNPMTQLDSVRVLYD